MIYYIISFIVGSFFGMFIMALAAIAKQSDNQTEKIMRNHFKNENKNNNVKQLELF